MIQCTSAQTRTGGFNKILALDTKGFQTALNMANFCESSGSEPGERVELFPKGPYESV